MTVEAATPAVEPEVDPASQEASQDEVPEIELDEDPASPEATQDETEEVEHEGKKYKIPRPLKPALMMRDDYTRKTTEIAEQRRQIEEQQTAFAQSQKAHTEHLSDFARVVAYNDAIAQFEKADWPQIRANNPAQYDALWFQYQQTKDARDKAVVALQTKVQERASTEQRETAKRLEQARAAIQRDIPDWSPELATKLNQFAIAQGFTPAELGQVTDPRIIKLLHSAYVGSQAQVKAVATTKAKATEAVKPLPTVSGKSPDKVSAADAASDRLSTEEWLKRRNAQVHKKRA